MNEDARKELTIFLGECWHNKTAYLIEEGLECGDVCMKCFRRGDNYDGQLRQRTFTSPQDMVDLARKMVEKDVWYYFISVSMDVKYEVFGNDRQSVNEYSTEGYADLFTNPERFCQLAYDSGVWRD